MAYLEPVILEGRSYTLRHIGPSAKIFPGGPPIAISTKTVLQQTTMVGRNLPMANQPNSSDFVSGLWTGRLGDAGEMSLTFPNKEATDGTPWRNCFDGQYKNQWIEIRNDGSLEAVCCIEKVDKKRDQIVITGHDGFWQTKNAYARDWIVVQAPRDVIEHGTQVWMPTTVDSFPAGSLNAQWTTVLTGAATVTIGNSGGAVFTVPGSQSATIHSAAVAVTSTQVWSATCQLQVANIGANVATLLVTESSGDLYFIQIGAGVAILNTGDQSQLPTAPSYTLQIESDGEYVWHFVNGQLIGCYHRGLGGPTTSLTTQIKLNASSGSATSMTAASASAKVLQPFLQRGSDKGDYVLPGTISTYPSGGLHARYYNNLDLQSDTNRLIKYLAPTRSQAYGGSGVSEYANQQDATINSQANPTPGAATTGWAVRWFGAIYLKLSAGNYSFSVVTPAVNTAVRVWIGKTQLGDQNIDQWQWANHGTLSFTLPAANLAGSPPFGGAKVQRDGWYPIRIEYAVDASAGAAPTFNFTNSPAAYTDPGGTAIASGAQTTVVPATSLSPLGCVDQRYQGVSHFDLIQKTALAFGHQIALEPQSLESDLFPGVLAPRIHEGQDFDAILEPDDVQRTEGLLNYGNLLDSTDSVTSLIGNGAGFQNGSTGQLQAEVYDPASLRAALFDIQGWQDFSDASFAPLLRALLNSQLGLRLSPWQVITGEPVGRPRLAFTWPLPSALAQQRWRPGDGMRIYARDVGVQDLTPRQLLLVTRQIHPNGTTGTQVGFAARPRDAEFVLKQNLFQAGRWGRNYQRQLVTLPSPYLVYAGIAAGGFTGYSILPLSPGDTLVRVVLRVPVVGASFNVEINGSDQTTTLHGPWITGPIILDVSAVATPSADNRLYVRLKNNSGGAASYEFQLQVDVLR